MAVTLALGLDVELDTIAKALPSRRAQATHGEA
jgi:hypothetical protein